MGNRNISTNNVNCKHTLEQHTTWRGNLLLTLIARGGGGGANFAAHATLPRFQDLFSELVLWIFWHQICENRTLRYGVTWPFVIRGQPEKWLFFFILCTKEMAKWILYFDMWCKSVIFPLLALYIIYSNLILIQMKISNSGNHKTIKYIKIKNKIHQFIKL